MYCKNCGEILPEDSKLCTFCDANSSLVGYSDKINDPRIAENLKKVNKSGMIFTLVLAVAAVVGFTIAGILEVRGFEHPFGFFLGLTLGVLLIVMATFQRAKGKRDGTWDGIVVDKAYKKASYAQQESGDYRGSYFIHVQRKDGSIKKLSCTEDLFKYYQVGDQVRHHGGTVEYLLEKYDKSKDSVIYCIVCSSKNMIHKDICHRCKSPLLK